MVKIKNTLGDFISGVCKLVDGTILIVSLGLINVNTSMKWALIRIHHEFLIEMPKTEDTTYLV